MSIAYREQTLGGLQTLVVAGQPDGLTIAVLHGFGADAFDLLPLCREIAAPAGTTWLFPHAPLEVPLGPQMTGRAWFPIDVVAMQLAMLSGRAPDLARHSPPELRTSQAKVVAMLRDHGTPMAKTVLAGFSQGAMTATALALHADEAPAGLAILSGTLLDAELWQQLAPAKAGMRFVQSHGRDDALLSYAAAQRLYALLTAAGWLGEFVGFGGGHEIPGAVLRKFEALLAATVTR